MSYIGNQPVLQTTQFRDEFPVTASTQTAFYTGGFHPSAVSVYRNGVLLSEDDYTKGSDNVTITLANAAVSGDIVVIEGNRSLAQGVSVSESRVEYTWQSGDTVVQLNTDVIPAYTDVYLNGVKLAAADYTIDANAKTVSFNGAGQTAPTVGDVIAVVHKNETSALVALPLKDSAGNNVLSESAGTVTLTADTAVIEGSSSGDLVRITQTGSGNALVVEDSANPDSTPFVVNSSGYLGIGTTTLTGFGTPDETNGGEGIRLLPIGFLGIGRNSGIAAQFNRSDNGTILGFRRSGIQVGRVDVTASATAYFSASDYRLKENITEITDGITRVKQLNPSRFKFIADPDKTVDGFIAHEVQDIIPEAVSGEKDAVDSDGKPEYQCVDYGRITPLLTAALKEAIAKIEMLEDRIAVLEAK